MKKLLAGILTFILVLGGVTFSQPSVSAADSPGTVTAHLTVSVQDDAGKLIFAKARDGSDMAVKEVQVSDQDGDGILTVYDLLSCAHEQLAPGGASDFSVALGRKNTATAKKIWGIEGTFYFLEGKW